MAHYVNIEKERAALSVAVQHQHLVEKEGETERKRALIDAQRNADVEAIELERAIRHIISNDSNINIEGLDLFRDFDVDG